MMGGFHWLPRDWNAGRRLRRRGFLSRPVRRMHTSLLLVLDKSNVLEDASIVIIAKYLHSVAESGSISNIL